jgi:hypothetical protein
MRQTRGAGLSPGAAFVKQAFDIVQVQYGTRADGRDLLQVWRRP